MNKIEYQFIKLPDADIQVNATKCGMLFTGIAIIHDPNSINPLISIPKPLGINGVKEILQLFSQIVEI
jgi:hypothetical protein